MENLDLSIVLPAHNEGKNLPGVLKSLKAAFSQANIKSEIIVVDNGSIDNTPDVLRLLREEISELRTLRIEEVGAGIGTIRGLEVAQAPILGFMDADGQVRPEDAVKVFLKLKDGNLDLGKGTRVGRFFSLERKILSKVYNFLFQLMFRSPFKDINGSPKFFTRRFYQAIKPVSKDWFLDAEIMLKAQRGKYAVGEVPIVYLERKGGGSNVSILTIFEFLKNMFYRFLFKR